MRQTSVDAFRQIMYDGLLSKRRFQVYQLLFHRGPLTAHEVVSQAREIYNAPNANQTSFNARLSELKAMGVVCEVGEKYDDLTKHRCILWDVTSKLPTPLKKKKTKCELAYEKGFEDGKLHAYRGAL